MRTWLSRTGVVLRTEIDDVRRRPLDLDPADLTQFTFPLVIRLLGVLAIGAVPLLVIRNSNDADDVAVPLLGSIALTLISTAVVAWLITIAFSGLVLVIFYRTPPHTASRLVIRTVIDAFRRISDATALLVTLALVAGVVAFAIGLPSRRDREAAYSMIDDLLAAQVGVLLADWLPGSIDGVPQEQLIAGLVPPAAQWVAILAPLPVIGLIWGIEAQRHNGFQQMRQFLNRDHPGSVGPMTVSPENTRTITETVHRYIDLVANGSADDLVGLYADDATVEDPVGGEVHIGHQAIRGFYTAITGLDRKAELVTLRVAGSEAAFHFALTITNGDHRMRIEPIDVMVFDGDGKIAGMKAYWSAENITQL